MTSMEHEVIMERVSTLLEMDQSALLPMHEKLLHQDLKSLGEGSKMDSMLWVAQMESGLDAAHLIGGIRMRMPEIPVIEENYCRLVKRSQM